MTKLTFNKFINSRKTFLTAYKNVDHKILTGTNNILISVPHCVQQVRLGKHKAQELGSLPIALFLQKQTNCFLIAKTKCNNDDVNFDENSSYKNSIRRLIKEHNIKFILDLHGLASFRECDINLGTHLGNNIKNDIELFNQLDNDLKNNGFQVSIDQPFMANAKTISSCMAKEFKHIWSLQIEINSKITNKKENFNLNYKLLEELNEWITKINTKNTLSN
jgi:hypothetical protein